VGYRPDRRTETQIRRQLRPELLRIGKQLAEAAAERSPSGVRASETAEFSTSFRAIVAGDNVIVGSSSLNAHIVEFGSRTTPEFAPFRASITAAGLELRDPGKSGGRSGYHR